MAFTGFTLPDIKESDLNDEKQRRQILEYLYQLTEQLRFTLSNLDEENFSDKVNENIQGAYTAASSASKEVKDMNGNVSRVKQFADSLTLKVENGDTSSTISLMANNAQIASEEIILKGAVTFTDLETEGRTIINGSNIKTGKVAANVIDVDNLYVKHLNGADGTFSGTLSAVTGKIGGFTISGNNLNGSYVSLHPGVGGGEVIIGNCKLTGLTDLSLNQGLFIGKDLGVEEDAEIYGTLKVFGGGNTEILLGKVSGLSQVSICPDGAGVGNVGGGSYYWDQVKANSHPTASSLRYKKNVSDITDEDVGNIDDIRAVTYELKSKEDGKKYPGFIAEELAEIAPLFVRFDDEGLPESIDYSRIVVMLVHEIKKLRSRVAALEAKEE